MIGSLRLQRVSGLKPCSKPRRKLVATSFQTCQRMPNGMARVTEDKRLVTTGCLMQPCSVQWKHQKAVERSGSTEQVLFPGNLAGERPIVSKKAKPARAQRADGWSVKVLVLSMTKMTSSRIFWLVSCGHGFEGAKPAGRTGAGS